MIRAYSAFQRLKEGNERFVNDRLSTGEIVNRYRRDELSSGQNPFAVVLGCADSRVPSELVFDQGLGDLFVVRVAGNIVSAPLIGSVEYAVENMGARLIVIMGHTSCGAVSATVQTVREKSEIESHNLRSVVDAIRPSVERVMEDNPESNESDLVEKAIEANIVDNVALLKQQSRNIEKLIEDDCLIVVGAKYSLDSGKVVFFEEPPEPG